MLWSYRVPLLRPLQARLLQISSFDNAVLGRLSANPSLLRFAKASVTAHPVQDPKTMHGDVKAKP